MATAIRPCDLCKKTGAPLHAGYTQCVECKHLMCPGCVQTHNQKYNTPGRKHTLKPMDQPNAPPQQQQQQNGRQQANGASSSSNNSQENSDSATTSPHPSAYQNGSLLTCCKHGLKIEFYCPKDESPVCKTCRLIDHRRCAGFALLEEAAGDHRFSLPDALESVQIVQNELFKVSKAKAFARENLQGKRQQILVQLQTLRERFECLEQNTVSELDQIYQNSANELDKDTDMISKTQELVDQLKSDMESVGQGGSDEEKFVAAKAAEKELKQYSEVLEDTSVITLTDIHFTPHVFWKQVEQVGNVGQEKMTHQLGLTKFIPFDIPLKVDTDENDAFISSLELLDDGRKLLLDVTNNKLKLFSVNNQFLSEVTFPEEAYDVALLNDSVALVTIPSLKEKALQKVNIIDDALKIEGCMQIMNSQPNLVTRVNEQTFLIVSIHDNKVFLMMADHAGTVTKAMASASGIKKMIQQPVTARISADKRRVYILDLYNGCIIVDIPAMKVSQHRDLLYDFHGGMAVSPDDGSVFLECGRKENDVKFANILQLTAEGQVVRKLFPSDISPRIIPLKVVGKKMYVFTKNPDKGMVLGCLHHYLL